MYGMRMKDVIPALRIVSGAIEKGKGKVQRSQSKKSRDREFHRHIHFQVPHLYRSVSLMRIFECDTHTTKTGKSANIRSEAPIIAAYA